LKRSRPPAPRHNVNLGSYTQKLLVSDQVWDHTRSNLRALAEARRVAVVELPSFAAEGNLAPEDVALLRHKVCEGLDRKIVAP